jgi:hypothetical protein
MILYSRLSNLVLVNNEKLPLELGLRRWIESLIESKRQSAIKDHELFAPMLHLH